MADFLISFLGGFFGCLVAYIVLAAFWGEFEEEDMYEELS